MFDQLVCILTTNQFLLPLTSIAAINSTRQILVEERRIQINWTPIKQKTLLLSKKWFNKDKVSCTPNSTKYYRLSSVSPSSRFIRNCILKSRIWIEVTMWYEHINHVTSGYGVQTSLAWSNIRWRKQPQLITHILLRNELMKL